MEKKNDSYTWATEKIRLVDSSGKPLLLTSYPQQHRGMRQLRHESADCTVRILDMHGYDYMMAEYTVLPHTNLQISIGSDTPVLMLVIFLEGSLLQYNSDGTLMEHMLRFQWNIMFLPVLNERLAFRKNECYRIFVVHFELSYLLQWQGAHPPLDRFVSRSRAGISTLLCDGWQPPAPVKMLAAIERMTPTDRAYTDQMFREVRVLEVLFHAVESLLKERPERRSELRDADIQKVSLAQGYIVDHFSEAVTLESLAHALGINVRKLKLGFPYVYGVTFYALLTAVRMERAGLLLEQDHTIREVCNQVGYRSSSHFAEAFHKYFGYAPERRRHD